MRIRSLLAVGVAALIIGGCGSSGGYGSSPTNAAANGRYGNGATATAKASATTATARATTASTTTTTGTAPTVALGQTDLGIVLVDGRGRTLYAFTKDTEGAPSACTAGCATAWPPVVAETPTAGAGLDPSKISLVARPDGGKQVAYAGHLLYRYAGDAKPGDITGQKVGGTWFAIDAAGKLVGA